MIIECINCNKKFEVDPNLIPENGRLIQCGSCKHSWHFKINIPSQKPLNFDKVSIKQEETEILKDDKDENESLFDKKLSNTVEIPKIKAEDKSHNIKVVDVKVEDKKISNFFSYLLVTIISFVALIILLDTLKSPLIKIFPGLEIILFNFFELLKDIKLFIIDLK